MITLQQFREQNPQYADTDSVELAAKIYKSTPSIQSSDVSFEEFADIFGVKDDIAATRNGFMDTINAIGAGIKTLPGQLKASAASAFQGGDVPAQDTSGVDNAITENEAALQGYIKEHGKNTGDSFLGVTPADVAGAMSNLGFSGVSAATGLAAGATAALTVPVPGAGYAAGMGATGKTAYNMARNQITRTFRDVVNEERISKGKQPMNDDEWATVKSKFDEKAHEYGLWEAIPEAVGSAVGFKILTAPLKSLVGEKLTGNILEKLATGAGRFAATAGEELTTETITQKGQGKIEYDIGLRDKQPTTREAFNEVYGQTVALTGIMGAGAKSAHKAYTTFVKKDKPADLLNPEAGGQPGEKEHTEQPVQTPVSEQAPKLTATNVSDQMDTSAAAPVNEEYSNRSAGPVTIPQQNLNPSLQKDAQIPEAPVQPHEKTSLFPPQSQEEQLKMEADIMRQRDVENQQPAQDNIGINIPAIKKYVEEKEPKIVKSETDIKANEAATSQQNDIPEPTEGQISAGNYKKGHVEIEGLKISIENPQGSIREGKNQDGKEWSTDMRHHYGYVRGTVGRDKDHIDAFIKPGATESPKVFVVDQVDPKTGKFDEHKIMIGFNNKLEAGAAYKANYEQGWKGGAGITEMSVDKFKKWAFDGKRKTKPVSELKKFAEKKEPQFVNEYKQAAIDEIKSTKVGTKQDVNMPEVSEKPDKIIDKKDDILKPIDELTDMDKIPKKLTKKEKALNDYNAYIGTLSDEERSQASDLIEDEPKSPAGQILKIKKALAKKPATIAPEVPQEIPELPAEPEQPKTKEVKDVPVPQEQTPDIPDVVPDSVSGLDVQESGEVVKKEPWEISREEYFKSEVIAPGLLTKDSKNLVYRNHEKSVAKALSDGKKVPENVLKDYPELANRVKNESKKNVVSVKSDNSVISEKDEKKAKKPETVSIDTFNSWKKSGGVKKTVKGWSVFDDTDIRNQYVLMRKVKETNKAGGGYVRAEMVDGFKNEKEAVEWAKNNSDLGVNQKNNLPKKTEETEETTKLKKYYPMDWVIYDTGNGGRKIEVEIVSQHEDTGQYYAEPIEGGNGRYISPESIVKLTKKGFKRNQKEDRERIEKSQTKSEKTNKDASQLSTDDSPGKGVNLSDIQKQFKGQEVFLGPNSDISVKFKNGQGVSIQSVKKISDKDYELALLTGRMDKNGIILGKYQDQTITLSKDYASVFTLRHEIVHLLEDLGIINKAETISLIWQAKRLKKQGKLKFKWNDKNMAENRANLLAQVLGEREEYRNHWLDKIIQRVVDFFDGLMHIGRASVRKLAREIESGKIYSRNVSGVDKQTSVPAYEQAAQKWYSQMEQVLEAKLPEKVFPKQALLMLKSWVKKNEFKQEEFEWSGLEDWLLNQEGKISKQEILDFLKENNVRVEEVVKGSESSKSVDEFTDEEIEEKLLAEDLPPLFTYNNREDAIDAAFPDQKGGKTKYDDYQLPGGENYKELLLTLPERKKQITSKLKEKLDKISSEIRKIEDREGNDGFYEEWELQDDARRHRELIKQQIELQEKNPDEYQKILNSITKNKSNGYKSPHWDEPNVLAHVRFSEREVDGKKILHIDEIQSDWHQEGRRKGYKQNYKIGDTVKVDRSGEIVEAKIIVDNGNWFSVEKDNGDVFSVMKDELGDRPNAPFKKTWPMLAFKRMVRYASENGFDTIAWTPGEIQAERYDLSKQVKSIQAAKKTDGSYFLRIYPNNSELQELTVKDDSELADTVGKELADKISNQPVGDTKLKDYEGIDLKVGGEGMKSFYDKMLPSMVNKFFNKKKWGNAKVGDIKISKIKLHSLPITTEMKQKALREGMPQFQTLDKSNDRDKIQLMTSEKGKGDIPTVETSDKPDGGETMSELKTQFYDKERELKNWLYDNVDHWTWKTHDPYYFKTYRASIPKDKINEYDSIVNDIENLKNKRVNRLKEFVNKKNISDFSDADLSERISYGDMNIASGWDDVKRNTKQGEEPIGPERVYFRFGKPPESGKSYNSMTNSYEEGVSVYITPVSGSMASDNSTRDIYYGNGEQIGVGGDDEPLIRITSEWKKYSPNQSRTPDTGVQKSSPQFQTTDDFSDNPDFDTDVNTWKGILPGIKNVFTKWNDKGKNYKPDLNFVETTLWLLSHNADKVEGLKRFFNELIKRPEYKFWMTNKLSKDGKLSLPGVLEDLKKHNRIAYNRLRNYLLDRDVNQIGTLVVESDLGWKVLSEKKKGKRTLLKDGFSTKKDAREWAIDHEVENYKDLEGKESLKAFRNLTSKLHDYYAETWNTVINEYQKRGLTLPQVVMQTSSGETRIDLKVALAKMGERSAYYFPRQRNNGEWKVIGKKEDGTTFIDYRDNRIAANVLAGRLKEQGYNVQTKITGKKPDGTEFVEYRDNRTKANALAKELKDQGYDNIEITEPIEKVGKISEDVFQSVESVLAMQAHINQALAETKLEEKIRGLEDLDLKAYWDGDDLIIQNGDAYRWSADVLNQLGGEAYSHLGPAGSSYNPNFRFENASKDMAEIVTNALLHAKGVDQDVSFTLAKAMAEQLADILRSRGSQARMIARMDAVGKDVPVGYETDPLKAIGQAINSAAGGYAKRELALKATNAITGRLQSWDEFQESHDDYAMLGELEQEREDLSANTESEKSRIRNLEQQLKKLQQERVATTAETEKGKRTRLLNISNIHDELNKIRKWKDSSKAANLQKKITRIRSNMHKDYQTSINDNRIDPKRQKNAYNDAVSALKNVLRNEEASDRVIKTVRGLTSLWFLGGRVSSAIVNLTSMGTSVPASMNAYGEIDFKKIPALIGKASKAYASFVMGKGHVSAEDRAILEEIDSRGWVAAQLNMEVVNAIKSGSAQKYSRFTEIMMTPFKITEEFNRAVTILAAYNGIRVNNPEMSVEDALQKAKTVSDRAHGIYGEENTPALLRKGEGLHAVSSMYIFQTYLHNYYNTMAQMFGRKQAKAFIYMGLSGAVFGGISSAPIIAAAMMLLKALDVDEPEEEIYAMAEEIFGESGSDVARFGLPGLAGISLKGSLAPNLPDFEEPIDILGPIGGMMRNWWDGAVNITKGDYLKGAEKLLPLAAGNVVKGYRETTQGVTTRAGDPVFFGKEQIKGDVGTGVTRALGFNPTKIAKPREIQWSETTLSNKYAEDKREIYSQIVRYFGQEPEDRDPDDWKDIVLEARKFNAKVKSHGIERLVPLISSKSIKDRLKRSSRPTKRERLRGEEQESNTMVDLPEDSETMVHNVWFSETYGELNKLAKNIRNYQQSGDLKKAAKLARENVDKIKLRKLFKEVDKDVRKINKAIKLVNLSKLDQETKKKRIDVLTKLKNDKVRKVYRLVHDKMKSTVRG